MPRARHRKLRLTAHTQHEIRYCWPKSPDCSRSARQSGSDNSSCGGKERSRPSRPCRQLSRPVRCADAPACAASVCGTHPLSIPIHFPTSRKAHNRLVRRRGQETFQDNRPPMCSVSEIDLARCCTGYLYRPALRRPRESAGQAALRAPHVPTLLLSVTVRRTILRNWLRRSTTPEPRDVLPVPRPCCRGLPAYASTLHQPLPTTASAHL